MRRVTLLTLLALALPMAALANIIDPAMTDFELQTGTPLVMGNFSGGATGCFSQPAISCSSGNAFDGHSVNVGGNTWLLNLVGPTGRIQLDITSLTTSAGANCALNSQGAVGSCNFRGTVTAFGTVIPDPSHMFTDSISGTVTKGPSVHASVGPNHWLLSTLTGQLGNQSGVVADSNLSVEDVQFCQGTQATEGCGAPGASGRLRTGFGAGTLDVDFQQTVIPEPGTLALLGTGVIGLAGMLRRKCKLGK